MVRKRLLTLLSGSRLVQVHRHAKQTSASAHSWEEYLSAIMSEVCPESRAAPQAHSCWKSLLFRHLIDDVGTECVSLLLQIQSVQTFGRKVRSMYLLSCCSSSPSCL